MSRSVPGVSPAPTPRSNSQRGPRSMSSTGKIRCSCLRGGSMCAICPEVAVVLEARCHARRDVVADLRGRGEAEALTRVVALQRLVDGGIERPVPAADLLIDDRPDLPRPRVRREIALLIAEFHRQAH